MLSMLKQIFMPTTFVVRVDSDDIELAMDAVNRLRVTRDPVVHRQSCDAIAELLGNAYNKSLHREEKTAFEERQKNAKRLHQ